MQHITESYSNAEERIPRCYQSLIVPSHPEIKCEAYLQCMSHIRAPGRRLKKLLKKIWRVSTRLSEHLIAIRYLNKFESVSISIRKQTNKQQTVIYINNLMFSEKEL